jgi:glycosyltransferase involved in cell wall biosynthesis
LLGASPEEEKLFLIFLSDFAFGRRIYIGKHNLSPDPASGRKIGMNMRLNLTLPVYNEEQSLPRAVGRLTAYLSQSSLAGCCEIVIAENGSTDRTYEVASELARACPAVQTMRVAGKGRGRALKEAWSESDAEVFSCMDIDLSTALTHYPRLIEPLNENKVDFAVGSRLLRSELTTRGWKREFISQGDNRLRKLFFSNRFSNAECGFKALTRRDAEMLLSKAKDDGSFCDTGLLED